MNTSPTSSSLVLVKKKKPPKKPQQLIKVTEKNAKVKNIFETWFHNESITLSKKEKRLNSPSENLSKQMT